MDYTIKPYGPKAKEQEEESLVSDPDHQYGEGHIWLICSKGSFSPAVYACEICNYLSNEKYVPLKCPGPRIGRIHWQELVRLSNKSKS